MGLIQDGQLGRARACEAAECGSFAQRFTHAFVSSQLNWVYLGPFAPRMAVGGGVMSH